MEFISQQTNISLGRQMVITLIRCALSMWTFGQHCATVKRYSADGEVSRKKRIWTRKSRVLWMHQVTLLELLLSYLFLYVFFARHRLLAHCCLWNSPNQTKLFGKNSLSCPMICHFFWAARKRFSATIGARRVVCRGWRSLKPKGTDGCHRRKEGSNGWPFFGEVPKAIAQLGYIYIYVG